MKAFVLSAMLMALGPVSATAGEETPVPGGWGITGFTSQYRIGMDRETRHSGTSAGFVQSSVDNTVEDAFGSIVQTVNGKSYRGKRVRLAAFVKTQDLREWAGLWMRIDGKRSAAAFDNMQERPIKGTTDWNRYEVVLQVPDDAIEIMYGVLQNGPGQTWMDDMLLETVGTEVATTELKLPGDSASPELSAEQQKRAEETAEALPNEVENPGFEQTKGDYDLALMQGLWEAKDPAGRGPDFGRITKQIQGNKETITFYDKKGEILHQHKVDFSLEQSGRVSLFTYRNMEVTAGPFKGQKRPPGASVSYIYTVHRSTFVEIVGALDGNTGPPRLTEWKRVPGN